MDIPGDLAFALSILKLWSGLPNRLQFGLVKPSGPMARIYRKEAKQLLIAEFQDEGYSSESIRLSDPTPLANNSKNRFDHCYDLSSPREWLEFCEAKQEQRLSEIRQRTACAVTDYSNQAGGGAYTVLRCDFLIDSSEWRVWGEDYHWKRLQDSYTSLQSGRLLADEGSFSMALKSSKQTTEALLYEAEAAFLNASPHLTVGIKERGYVGVMLTVLWTPEITAAGAGIKVSAHACSTMKPSELTPNNPNSPIDVVIGCIPANKNWKQLTRQLPNRYDNHPQAKLSSWCRRRRPLEENFKKENIADVILTKVIDSSSTKESPPLQSLELLEGLTSNMFVVYPRKVLQTPPSSLVLGGYVRQLILDCAEECGYTVEIAPISLKDTAIWKGVFLTSSIKLIIPVHKMLFPSSICDDGSYQTDIVWREPTPKLTENPAPTACDLLYKKIIMEALKNKKL